MDLEGKLLTIEQKYWDLLTRLGVNGHDGAIAEIKLLRRIAELDKEENKNVGLEERMNEIAQAYCTERNSHKIMDSELMLDVKEIALRIAKEYAEEMCKRQREICAEQDFYHRDNIMPCDCEVDNNCKLSILLFNLLPSIWSI